MLTMGRMMRALIDMTGIRYGRLVAIDISHKVRMKRGEVIFWNFQCDCGQLLKAKGADVRTGHTKSCGCLQRDTIAEMASTHRMTGTKAYMAWKQMKRRCNKDSTENYGSRGISYDERWSTFELFWEDMGGSYVEGLELDRIDVNGNYCKENCRWADNSLQAFNKRKVKTNTSGRTGVSFNKKSRKWYTRITVKNVSFFLGEFENFEQACEVRAEAELKYFGFTKE